MLEISPPNYKFCPICGTDLVSKLGEGKTRKHCPSCSWIYYPHVSAGSMVLVRKGDQVLVVKRAIEPFKNTWMFPAGFIEFGEHPEDAAKRELKEETGLACKKLRFLEVGQSEDDPRALGHFIFLYEAVAEGEIKNSDKNENMEIQWVSIKNPPEIGWKYHKQVMRKLQLGEL